MQAQDSTHETGVAVVTPSRNSTKVARSRNRKTNSAIQMKLAGATWDEIAEVLGYPTARTAKVAVERALEKELQDTDRVALRRFAAARLDRLLRGTWTKAIDPNHPEHLVAVQRARELIDRHAKLYGLDAPTEVVVHNPSASELEAWVARVVSVGLPEVEEYDILEGEVVSDAVSS